MSEERKGPDPFFVLVFVYIMIIVAIIGYQLQGHKDRIEALEKAIKVEVPK